MKQRLALRGLGAAAVATLIVASAMAMPVAGRSIQSNGADRSTGTTPAGVTCTAIFQTPAGRWNLMATVQLRDASAYTHYTVYLRWSTSDGTAADLSTGSTGAGSVHLQRHVSGTSGDATVRVMRGAIQVCTLTQRVTLKTR